MVLVSGGNPEIGVHVRSDLDCRICLRQLLRSIAVTHRNFFSSEKTCFPSHVRNNVIRLHFLIKIISLIIVSKLYNCNHSRRKKVFWRERIRIVTALDLMKCLD